jgi:hypothetical protein
MISTLGKSAASIFKAEYHLLGFGLCSSIKFYQHFREIFCLHLQQFLWWHHNRENQNFNIQRLENLLLYSKCEGSSFLWKFVHLYLTSQSHIPYDSNLRTLMLDFSNMLIVIWNRSMILNFEYRASGSMCFWHVSTFWAKPRKSAVVMSWNITTSGPDTTKYKHKH